MGISTSTGILTAGQSRTFNLSPASAVTLTLSPNVRVTITETPATVAATGLGGNASRVHEPRLPGVVTYGPYPMGGSVLVENESNSGSSVAWVRSDSIVAESADGSSSLVDAAGIPVSFAGPAYTWVNRPAASGNAGMVIRITDIGPTAFGSLWVSDGVNWNTLNGRQVLAAGRSGAPGSALTTVAAIGKMALPSGQMISGGSLVLPAGLIRVGVGLRVEAMIRHTGTAGTWTATWRIGTANTSGDSAIVSNGGSATNDEAQWAFMDLNFSSTSAAVTGFNMIPQGAAGAGSLAARTTNIDTAAAMYVAPHLSALTAPDTLELISYCISLHD